MSEKPTTAVGYTPDHVELVRATCLYAATKLGDLTDDLVVVGGLVPSLLIRQDALPDGADAHVGTMDLDVGLTLALLEEGRYRALTDRLRGAGFVQDVNEDGRPTRQRWKIEALEAVTVDFLIPPSRPDDKGGKLRSIEREFAAVISPGLHLAFRDRERMDIEGKTIMGERARREIWVSGPGAYVILKSLAFRFRGENKDAYDLYYLLRNYGAGVIDVARRLEPLLEDPEAQSAIDFLREDFAHHDSVGPRRVAEFLTGASDDTIQADVVGFIGQLLEMCVPNHTPNRVFSLESG